MHGGFSEAQIARAKYTLCRRYMAAVENSFLERDIGLRRRLRRPYVTVICDRAPPALLEDCSEPTPVSAAKWTETDIAESSQLMPGVWQIDRIPRFGPLHRGRPLQLVLIPQFPMAARG